MGVAYAAPPLLNLRSELGPKSQIAATVKHGDRLDVLETRRRFARVRTREGVEGWTDMSLLLSDDQMASLRALAAGAAKLPSEGTAKVYDALNVHAEPYRQSPSFFQIPENGTVEVIGHRVTPHAPPAAASKPAHVHRAASSRRARSRAPITPLTPPPPPPGLPADWLERSKSRPPSDADLPAAPPVPEDDWYLVRTRSGDTGWALARMLVMAVPDEVAQYAEGHRVTAYLPLGEVEDKERNQTKPNWLWATASAGLRPYDFDSFRVFVWSTKHHRYETAYIERNVKGYYPVLAETLPGEDGKAFSLVLEEKDGQLYKEVFAFSGYRIHLVSKTPYHAPPSLPEVRPATSFEPEPAPAPVESSSLTGRVRSWLARFRRK